MSEPANQLARREPDALSKIVGTGDTRAMLDQVERNVRDVIAVARERGFVQRYGGSQHEFFGFPAWSLLALTYGLVPFVEWTRKVDDGWEARAVVRTRDGEVVAAAEAMCTKTERNRRQSDDHTLRAMAQTRAMRNALRSCLGAALVLSGFDFADPEGPATREQVGLLHQLERELNMSHDEGHAAAGEVESYKDLNREDASTLIDRWTALREEMNPGGGDAASPPRDMRSPSRPPAPADAEPMGGAGGQASENDAPEGRVDTRRMGKAEERSEGPSGASPTGDVDAAWARAPHDLSRVQAIKLAKKLIDEGRMDGLAPATQAQFSAEQVARVSAAYRDGERG